MWIFCGLLMCIMVVYGGSKLEVSYKDCTSANAVGKLDNVVFVPAQPQISQNFTYVYLVN